MWTIEQVGEDNHFRVLVAPFEASHEDAYAKALRLVADRRLSWVYVVDDRGNIWPVEVATRHVDCADAMRAIAAHRCGKPELYGGLCIRPRGHSGVCLNRRLGHIWDDAGWHG